MSGKVIQFRDLKRAGLFRQQAVPRESARQATIELQIARISSLLGELEELSGDHSSPLLLQARSSIEGIRKRFAPQTGSAALDGLGGDDDPQPDVDPALLERMYRDLNTTTDR
jgi:hypothetical protein